MMEVIVKANPGPPLPPQDVIGREKLIKRLWDILENRSVALTAERRMGKTCLVKKMQAETPAGILSYYRDLEDVHTVLEFAQTLFQDVEKELSKTQRAATRTQHLLTKISGTEFSGFRFPDIAASHWKELLNKILDDLVTNQEQTLVFFWDELPWMIANIKQNNGERVAMEVLDTLRKLRQTHPKLRMVYTGSIGLHHVLVALKKKGYANAPINDMESVDVPPLSIQNAERLAALLLEGEQINCTDRSKIASVIAKVTGNVPFYIHKVVDEVKYRDGVTSEVTIDDIVASALTDSQDPWDLSHYRMRIDTYYYGEVMLVLNLLDVLALTDKFLTFEDLLNQVKSRIEIDNDERVRDILGLLQRDHYVERQIDGKYGFRFPLIRRWWKIDRGLE